MRSILAAAALLAACVSTPCAAENLEFLFSPSHVRNDTEYFLNLAVADSGYGRAVLEPVLPRLRNYERDLPVVLFLAKASGRPVGDVVKLRDDRLSWPFILTNLKLTPDILFAGIERDPGPPYGKAWGYWKKQAGQGRLSDDDIAGLVHVQLGSRWASTGAYDLAHDQGSRKQVVKFVANKRGRPYKQASASRGGKPQKSKGKGKGSAY